VIFRSTNQNLMNIIQLKKKEITFCQIIAVKKNTKRGKQMFFSFPLIVNHMKVITEPTQPHEDQFSSHGKTQQM